MKLLFQIRVIVILIMLIVVISGLATCFPLSTLHFLSSHPHLLPGETAAWVDELKVSTASCLQDAPFMAYAFIWLGFSHFIIALLFAGVISDPVKNKWVIVWAIICCFLSIPFIFITGLSNGIPLFHCFFDCSFSIAGILLLYILLLKIKKIKYIFTDPGMT